jgi:hypothetical protein
VLDSARTTTSCQQCRFALAAGAVVRSPLEPVCDVWGSLKAGGEWGGLQVLWCMG